MGDTFEKRQRTCLIDDGNLKAVLNGQENLSSTRFRLRDTNQRQKEYPCPELTGCLISAGLDGQGYKILESIGVPGGFGIGWKAQRSSTQSLRYAVKQVVSECKSTLLALVQKLIEKCEKVQPTDQYSVEDTVMQAVSVFQKELQTWQLEFHNHVANNDYKRKACDQICAICVLYVKRAGFDPLCHPSIERLNGSMNDMLQMIQQESFGDDDSVFVKTYFIPKEKFPTSDSDADKYVGTVRRELESIKEMLRLKIEHDHIAKIYDVLVEAEVFGSDDRLIGKTVCVVQELVDGGIDLWEWVEDWRLNGEGAALGYPGVARHFFRGLIDAVAVLHEKKIFHYDIKIENIMISRRTKTLKLIDFGLGKVMRSGGVGGDVGRAHSIDCPDKWYLAPEVRRTKYSVPAAADVWGCGVVLLALAVRQNLSGELELAKSFDDFLVLCKPGSALAARFDGGGDEDGPALKDLLRRCCACAAIAPASALTWPLAK